MSQRTSGASIFVAIDFETADYGRDSACAVALVRVEGEAIVAREQRLIRPPRQEFVFSYLHGITWDMVRREPLFGRLWPEMKPFLHGAEFLVAHNASFDRSVLETGCRLAGLPSPELPFQCTMKLARSVFQIYPTKLPDVCRALALPMGRHHDASADAEACARIMIEVRKVSHERCANLPVGTQPCSSSTFTCTSNPNSSTPLSRRRSKTLATA